MLKLFITEDWLLSKMGRCGVGERVCCFHQKLFSIRFCLSLANLEASRLFSAAPRRFGRLLP